jgi:hypothetical protein
MRTKRYILGVLIRKKVPVSTMKPVRNVFPVPTTVNQMGFLMEIKLTNSIEQNSS